MVPFVYGANQYVEKMLSQSVALTTSQQEIIQNITPGGFLRGVRVIVRSTGGALGGGTLSGDAPYSVVASATVENIDGSPILYPMSGYAHAWRQYFSRPWQGDPTTRSDYSATVNPSFSLFMQPEVRHTAGVLANTDARAQYRIKVTLATLAQFVTGGAPTAPTVTVTLFLEIWAQPDATDLRGTPIQPLPPGLALGTLARHQILNLSAAGADNTLQVSNTGNEHRLLMWIMRDSSGVRQNLASDPIRWRLDARSLGTFSPAELTNRAEDFYKTFGGLVSIPTGVYLFPRYFNVGAMFGEPWLATTNATYLIWETATATGGTGGTIEIITDEVAPIRDVPMEMESI
jgi:hypothetical protein